MPSKRNKKAKAIASDRIVAKKLHVAQQEEFLATDKRFMYASCWLMALILIAAIWWNRFLPMQDLPQHIFMAFVANTYDDPAFNWPESFELRNQFGPYRVTHLALRGLSYLMPPEASGKVLATVYVMLVILLVYRIENETGSTRAAWGALLFLPVSFHPMYFYGFINFFISIPLMLLALLDLRRLILHDLSGKSTLWQGALQVTLFLVHPYTLLVFIVLAFATVPLVAHDRRQALRGIAAASTSLILFLGGLWYESTIPASENLVYTPGWQPVWWPVNWNLPFLALHFTGMRIMRNPVWWVTACWLALLGIILWSGWRQRQELKMGLWFPVMFCLALAGYFVLPFSIQTDGRYTFFNARMAPILYFLFVPVVAAIPIGRVGGRLFAVLCLALTCYSAYLHHQVAHEISTFAPIFDNMEKNKSVLSLIGSSRSDHLDPLYFVNIHHCIPFYYHILKGGGTNPDMFDRRLMPVGYRPGRKPARPEELKLDTWPQYINAYDYVLVYKVTEAGRQRFLRACEVLASAGPWTLYKVRK